MTDDAWNAPMPEKRIPYRYDSGLQHTVQVFIFR
jgi:hypothetical protein